MRWSYGVVTAIERKEDLLPRTLDSLCEGGFDKPRLFVDGCNDPKLYEHFGLEVTFRYPKIIFGANHILALLELYARDSRSDLFALFEDDFVTYLGLREYLETCDYPETGYWNLYTFPQNQQLAPKHNRPCWFLSNQYGRGAVALVFSRNALITFFSKSYVLKSISETKGWKSVDGVILTAFKNAGWKEYCHNPSLVQHTGEVSVMGNRKHQKATSFRGEDFNAMQLVKEKGANNDL